MFALRGIRRWLTTWPRRVRWSWPSTAPIPGGPADLAALRFTDVDQHAIEIGNSGAGGAFDVGVRLSLRAERLTEHRRGDVPYLGPRTRYVLELVDAPLPGLDTPAGTWVQLAWRNRDGSEGVSWAEEREGRLEPRDGASDARS